MIPVGAMKHVLCIPLIISKLLQIETRNKTQNKFYSNQWQVQQEPETLLLTKQKISL